MICDLDGFNHEAVIMLENMESIDSDIRYVLLSPPGQTLEIEHNCRKQKTTVMSQPVAPRDILQTVLHLLDSDEDSENRREHLRYTLNTDTQCVLVNPFQNVEGRPLPALIRDISRSGISMIIRQLMPVPAMLKLSIRLSDQTRAMTMLAKSISCSLTPDRGCISVGGKVCWSVTASDR